MPLKVILIHGVGNGVTEEEEKQYCHALGLNRNEFAVVRYSHLLDHNKGRWIHLPFGAAGKVTDFVNDVTSWLADKAGRHRIIEYMNELLLLWAPPEVSCDGENLTGTKRFPDGTLIICHSLGTVVFSEALAYFGKDSLFSELIADCHVVYVGSPWAMKTLRWLRMFSIGRHLHHSTKVLAGSKDPVAEMGRKWAPMQLGTLYGQGHSLVEERWHGHGYLAAVKALFMGANP
jgi:hypothetical protein